MDLQQHQKILNLTTSPQGDLNILSQAPISSYLDYCKNLINTLRVSALFLILLPTLLLDYN